MQKTSARTDQHKAEYLTLSCKKCTVTNMITNKQSWGENLIFCMQQKKMITNKSSELQLNKSNGPDNIVNKTFKFSSAILIKSPFFQTMFNKIKFSNNSNL